MKFKINSKFKALVVDFLLLGSALICVLFVVTAIANLLGYGFASPFSELVSSGGDSEDSFFHLVSMMALCAAIAAYSRTIDTSSAQHPSIDDESIVLPESLDLLKQECRRLKIHNKRLLSVVEECQDNEKMLRDKVEVANERSKNLLYLLKAYEKKYLALEESEDESEALSCEELLEDRLRDLPMHCLGCQYFSDNDYIKCAVHPELLEDCQDFKDEIEYED